MCDFLRGVLAVVLFVTALVGAAPVEAQTERQERRRIPAEFMRFGGADWLEREERVAEEQPGRVLETIGFEPGDVVADIGCGSGYYARRIAPLVQPGGTVYCEDIQAEMLEIMERLAGEAGVTGIEPVLGTPVDLNLPAVALDWVVMADVYHEMSEPETMLAAIRRTLSPDGRVALLEYRMEDGTGDRIKADHRMSARQVLSEWKAGGFELVELHDFLPGQHLFIFRAATDAAAGTTLADYDLLDAIESGLVDVEAQGGGDAAVVIRIRRTGNDPIVVTSPVGLYLRSDTGARDMIARRDGWIVLSDDGWHEWSLRAVGRQHDRHAPSDDDKLEILPPSAEPVLEELMYQAQAGTYSVANSPTLYPPTTHGVEQAAVWIADADLGYQTIAADVEEPRIPAQYVVAFALVFVDRAGIDVTSRRVWSDSERIFGALRDQGLEVWYQLKRSGQ